MKRRGVRTSSGVALVVLFTATLVGVVHARRAGATLSLPTTCLFLDSEPGAVIGNGTTHTFTSVSIGGNDTDLGFTVTTQSEYFALHFAPAAGGHLAVGTYENAQRATVQDPGHPGIDINGDG